MTATIISFKVPYRYHGKIEIREEHGYPIMLQIGPKLRKFVLQLDEDGRIAELTDYATGQIASHIQAAARAEYGTARLTPLKYRQLAKKEMKRRIDCFGLQRVLDVMAKPPVLND